MLRQIAVVSGKGGTGKTTLSASLVHLARKVVIADCDVDAPNLHLIMNPLIVEKHGYSGSKKIYLDPSRCFGCGMCADACRFDAIERVGDGIALKDYACEGCNACALVCPSGALKLENHRNGEFYLSETVTGPMAHALLNPGEETSGGLIAEVRKTAVEAAGKENLSLVMIDGAPGIGCSATSSITSASYAVVVSEPTMSGLHDLKRLVETVGHFRIPTGLVINKYDINPEKTDEMIEYAKRVPMNILGRIPYDPTVKTAAENAKPVVTYDCPASKAIESVWKRLIELTGIETSENPY